MAQSIIISESISPENESSEDVSINENIIIIDSFSVENEKSNLKEKNNYENLIDDLLASDSDSEIELNNKTTVEIHNKEIENYEVLNSDSNFSANKTHKIKNEKLEDFYNCDTNSSHSHFDKNKNTDINSEMHIEYSVVIKKELHFSENKIPENNIMEDVNYFDSKSLSNEENKVKSNQILVSEPDLNLSNNPTIENVKIEPEEIENVDIVEPNQDEESPNPVNALYNASVQDAVRYFSEL